MYQVLFDDQILYDPRTDDRIIRDPDTHLAVGEPGSLAFTIDTDHPAVGELTKMKGTLELTEDGEPIYRGRIVRDEKDFYNSRRVETEGLLAALNDSIIAPFKFPEDFTQDSNYQAAAGTGGNVVAFFLGWILSQHNAQTDEDRNIKLGTVTVTDPNNYIARSSEDFNTAWATIKEKLVGDSLGGYLLPRYETDGTYLDYLAELTEVNTQPIEFGENLMDIVSAVDATEICSAILPVGKEGLAIESLPNGDIDSDLVKSGLIIYSKAARQQYGKITKTVKWDDVTVAANLKTKAAAELANIGALLTSTLTIKTADLHYSDEQIASFRMGKKVLTQSLPHGVTQAFDLVELNPDILDPGNTEITLGAAVKSQTDRNQATQSKNTIKMDKQTAATNAAIKALQDAINDLEESTIPDLIRTILTGSLSGYVQTSEFETFKTNTTASIAALGDTDTGWQTVNSALKYRLRNGVATVIGYSDGTVALTPGSEKLVGTIPTSSKPTEKIYFQPSGLGDDAGTAYGYIDTTGAVQIFGGALTDKWAFCLSYPV